MTLKELKETIESKKVPSGLVVLKLENTDFVSNQYIDFIKTNTTYSVEFVQKCADLFEVSDDIFGDNFSDSVVKIFKTDTFECKDDNLKKSKKSFVVCHKIEKKTKELFKDYIIEIPKLEDWQINDYAFSLAEGVNENQLMGLVKSCGDIYRLDQELQKINLFPKEQRQIVFDRFLEDNVFSDLSNYTIFDFSNAILKRDKKRLFELYRDIKNVDVEPVGLLVLLIKNFRNVISVQLSTSSSCESLGMKPNQYWAIKNNNCGFYTKEELMAVYSFLNSLDKKIKVGEMPTEHLIDYIIVKVLGV